MDTTAVGFSDRLQMSFEQLYRYVPALFGAMVILFAGYLLARLFEKGTERVLRRIKFNQLLERGGVMAAVERAMALSKERGVKRAVPLPVSAPFHCSLMQPAADTMSEALAKADVRSPLVPVYANVTASPASDPGEIRDLLVRQVTGTVRWRESVEAMWAAGVTDYVELGAKVLGPMVKRIAPDAMVVSVVSMADIEALAKAL